MPWSNQNGGGGPWGGGDGGNNQGGGPWGQDPRGSRGGGQPDLDEFIRRSRDQMKRFMPGGANGGMVLIGVFVIAAFWLFKAVYTVQPDERGVELLFGKPKDEISEPGLHFHFWPLETVEVVNITEQQQNIGGASSNNSQSGLMLTGDQNIVNVQFSVLYSVTEPAAYLFKVEDPRNTLRQVAESAMREVVGSRPAQDIYRDNRQAVADDVKTIIQDTLNAYQAGLSVKTVAIEDAAPPREVADAFDEVQRAEQDEDRFVEEANRYANQKLGRARGEAAQLREEAAAYKDRVVKEAEGEAQRFVAIYDEFVKAPDVTRKRLYIETLENVLKSTQKIITDEGAGGGTVPYLSLNELMKKNDTKGGN